MSANATAGVHSSVASNVGCKVVTPATIVVGRATPKEYCRGYIWVAVRSSTHPSYPTSSEILKVNVRNLAVVRLAAVIGTSAVMAMRVPAALCSNHVGEPKHSYFSSTDGCIEPIRHVKQPLE
eukprot:scaffold165075_cov52-Attheya_sp.AAC.2